MSTLSASAKQYRRKELEYHGSAVGLFRTLCKVACSGQWFSWLFRQFCTEVSPLLSDACALLQVMCALNGLPSSFAGLCDCVYDTMTLVSCSETKLLCILWEYWTMHIVSEVVCKLHLPLPLVGLTICQHVVTFTCRICDFQSLTSLHCYYVPSLTNTTHRVTELLFGARRC
jgi:hypothetical protein